MSHEQQETVEFYPDFKFELPKKDKGLKLFTRRVSQLYQIFTSHAFSNSDEILNVGVRRYETDEEMKFYRKIATYGFYEHEEILAKSLLERLPTNPKIFVVGCGAGREIFALNKIIKEKKIVANDLSPVMVAAAKELGFEADFYVKPVNEVPEENFDLIWVTGSLDGHIHGRKNRVKLYKDLKSKLAPGGIIAMQPRMDLAMPKRYKIGSILLRIRWIFSNKWEPGDTPVSFMGFHNRTEEMIYMHIYLSSEDFESEAIESGLVPTRITFQDFDGMWCLE